MSESVTITLGFPPKCLSPNNPPASRGGRIAKAKAAKAYRHASCVLALAAGPHGGPWRRATVRATFYHKERRRRDGDNGVAMLKPALDGLVDAGIVEDDSSDHLTILPPVFLIDKNNPRVDLRVERVE